MGYDIWSGGRTDTLLWCVSVTVLLGSTCTSTSWGEVLVRLLHTAMYETAYEHE